MAETRRQCPCNCYHNKSGHFSSIHQSTPVSHPGCWQAEQILLHPDAGLAGLPRRARVAPSKQAVPNLTQQEEPENSMPWKRSHVIQSSESESDCPANDSHKQGSPESERDGALPFVSCPPLSSVAPPPQVALEQNQGGLQALLSGALAKLVYLEEKFDAQAKALQRIETSVMANSDEETLSIKEEMRALLPLSTDVAVSSLDDLLRNEDNRKVLIHHLGLIGGSCLKDTVKNIMKRCMAYTLAEKYCFTGRKGKKAFRELRLLSVIIAALQKSYPRATESEVHHLIADHLRYAPACCKRRSRVLSRVAMEVEVPPRPSDY